MGRAGPQGPPKGPASEEGPRGPVCTPVSSKAPSFCEASRVAVTPRGQREEKRGRENIRHKQPRILAGHRQLLAPLLFIPTFTPLLFPPF